ncbi:hypothetical protein [Spongiactinospora sp. TRM90649]|uniref:hypothetical protein n=1 Tax=Spongiactinospora sp. TRM90649 TaxID=3031114 RepID=UPI0023F62F78|nr:hypothetical protein [Spongiactinospora sp. TRM90649]MDF5758576.1 hypothetical protein [Spongiactinospora sp. TRM90649]
MGEPASTPAPGPAAGHLAVVMSADGAQVLRLLADGKTTQQVADLTSWPRDRVIGLARAQKGWLLSPDTDTVYDPGAKNGKVRVPDTLAAAVPSDAAALIARAEASEDPRLRRLATQVRDALGEIRDRLTRAREAAALAQEIATLEEQLAAKKARQRQLSSSRRKGPARTPAAPRTVRPTARSKRPGIRAWAAAQGMDCPPQGRVPRSVETAWDEAHGGDRG